MRNRILAAVATALCPLLSHAGTAFDLPAHRNDTPVVAPQDIEQQVSALNKVIGSYPIRVSTDEQGQAVYQQWSAALQQAWALEAAEPRAASTFGLLADLYRQGHNLGVKGTAELADRTVSACLAAYPDSIRCNFAAAYFYLSVNPGYAPRGESALVRLRALFKPRVNLEVEKGFVFAYLFEGRKDLARTQLEYFLTLDSDADWAHKILDSLDKGQVIQRDK